MLKTRAYDRDTKRNIWLGELPGFQSGLTDQDLSDGRRNKETSMALQRSRERAAIMLDIKEFKQGPRNQLSVERSAIHYSN